jgi:hypothetical protein
LLAWANAGAPRGDGEDPLEVEPPAPAVDWPLGPPDVVVTIPVQQIPSFHQASAVPYRYITNASPFTTNVWLRAAVVRPANRRVVHHALVFAGSAQDLAGFGSGLGGFFAGYVPGVEQDFFPDGLGKQLKAGSLVVFQMHYTPRSTAQTDATELGLYLAAAPPARELKTGAAFNLSLFIGPGQKSVATFADKVFARASTIYEMSPHMHLRGASMRFDAIYPDHTVHPLLNVPNYDFAWQTMYRLAQPATVPAGTRLRVSGTFDNSVWNPYNPDPSRSVYFGEQTTDEMFIGYVNYAEN